MTIIVQDPELDTELQELYILSNHWNSDLSFLTDEIRFLKKLIDHYAISDLKSEPLNEVLYYKNILKEYDLTIPGLQNKISVLLKFIDPIINKTDQKVGLNLIEEFISLQTEIKTLSESVKQCKKHLFCFMEHLIKTEKLLIQSAN